MTYVVSYLTVLLVFGALDAVWLTMMGNRLYRATLGDIMLPDLRYAPALVFYFMYPIGIVIFAVAPALKAGSVQPALMYGLLFGLFAYATYDLTNYATLRNWTLQITLADLVYGSIVTAVSASAAFFAARAAAAWAA